MPKKSFFVLKKYVRQRTTWILIITQGYAIKSFRVLDRSVLPWSGCEKWSAANKIYVRQRLFWILLNTQFYLGPDVKNGARHRGRWPPPTPQRSPPVHLLHTAHLLIKITIMPVNILLPVFQHCKVSEKITIRNSIFVIKKIF
jgi:hypothetical protein